MLIRNHENSWLTQEAGRQKALDLGTEDRPREGTLTENWTLEGWQMRSTI